MGNVESSVFYDDEYGTGRRQPAKHLPESASYRRLDTSKLLDDLSKTFENWQEIIINLRTNQMPEGDAQAYLYQEMVETRDTLDRIMGYMAPSITSQLQPCESAKKPKEQRRMKTSTPIKSTKGAETLRRDADRYKDQMQLYKAETNNLTLKCASLYEELKRIEKERSEVLLRLSKLTSETLTSNNPNVADLADPHRPTKLGEMFSELYDNEWTDAFEVLQAAGKGERRSIQILFESFMDIFHFCNTQRSNVFEIRPKTASLLELLENDSLKAFTKHTDHKPKETRPWLYWDWQERYQNCQVEKGIPGGDNNDKSKSSALSDEDHADETDPVMKKFNQKRQAVELEINKHLQSLQQEFGEALLPFIKKAYLQPRWNNSCMKNLKPYIQKCLKVAWLMCIKSPPMAVADIPQAGDAFSFLLYKQYTHKGPYIDYIVWPALLLHDNGPVVSKGVAQGKE